MVAPGSLEARYQELAGTREQEFYQVRRRLYFTINEWLALPWWQRRVYLRGLRDEAEQRANAGKPAARQTGLSGLDAIYSGTLGDVAATTSFATDR